MSYTINPRADNPRPGGREATGQVASDSLAAESAQSGGAFSENDADISSVKGANSTFANTDTSGATVLAAAKDGASRQDNMDSGMGSDQRGTTGERYDPSEAVQTGTTSLDGGYRGGPSSDQYTSGGSAEYGGNVKAGREMYSGASGDSFADGADTSSSGIDSNIKSGASATGAGQSTSSGGQGNAGSNSGSGALGLGGSSVSTSGSDNSSTPSAGTAGSGTGNFARNSSNNTENDTSTSTTTGGRGSYADATSGRAGDDVQGSTAPTYTADLRSEGELKPKGENLVEGDLPKTKTFTGNVGGDKDPGRLAEQDFTKVGTGGSINAGNQDYGEKGTESTMGGQYNVLESERAPDVEQ